MTREEPSGPAPDALQALDRMQAALRILDEIEAPGDIGSHLDLAIARLRDRFGLGAETNPWALARSGRIEPAPADPEAGLPDAPDRAHIASALTVSAAGTAPSSAGPEW